MGLMAFSAFGFLKGTWMVFSWDAFFSCHTFFVLYSVHRGERMNFFFFIAFLLPGAIVDWLID
jgi:hypothetical protein